MIGRMTVAVTAWNRPDYLRQVLDAWSRVRGVGKAEFLFSVEPGCPEVQDICLTARQFAGFVRVVVNPERLGSNANTKQALDMAFRLSDYVILGTDDYMPADDTFELHAWFRDNYRDDSTALSLACWRDTEAPGGPAAVWRTQVIGWLSGFHRDRWEWLSQHFHEAPEGDWYSWVDELCRNHGQDVFRPAMSRAQDIGEVGWKPQPCAFDEIRSKSFSAHYGPQDYYEVRGHRERGHLQTWIEAY